MADSSSEADLRSDALAPDEAFAVLGNETRMGILRTLWEVDEPIPFAELHERTEYGDSGNFSYHLDKLVDHFVAQTEDGYELREAGVQVIRAVLAGAINENPVLGPIEVDAKCPYCGARVEMHYADEHLTVRCTRCPGVAGDDFPRGTYLSYAFPPAGLVDRSPEEILEAAHTLYDAKVVAMMDGVCPECAGRTTVSIDICEDHGVGDGGTCDRCRSRHRVWADYECVHCRYSRRCIVWFKLLNHPAVIAFFHEYGDLEETVPFSKLTWRNAPYVSGIEETVLDDDPLRIGVTIPFDDAELHVTIDEDANVVDLQYPEPRSA